MKNKKVLKTLANIKVEQIQQDLEMLNLLKKILYSDVYGFYKLCMSCISYNTNITYNDYLKLRDWLYKK